jgi:hypothetical protein
MSYRDAAFGIDEIEAFLRIVDGHLARPVELVIVGGGAAAFHTATTTTMDLDTYEALDAELRRAITAATAATGIDLPVGHASIAQLPFEAESRFERRLPDLVHLQVSVLEKHDLALSKVLRYVDHDEQQLVEVHQTVGLDYDVLVQRFIDEMDHVVGHRPPIRAQFLQMIERLFGEVRRADAARSLSERGR